MKKRIAYVGLSTPIGYDYRNEASRTKADLTSSPNPILDSPFGLFLLFDEIWFLSRSLCPDNLRDASFVKFLDETHATFINEIDFDIIIQEVGKQESEIYAQNTHKNRVDFQTVINKLDVDWDIGLDNHTHGISIGNSILSGNVTLDKLLFDMKVVKMFEEDGVELITNTLTQRWFENENQNHYEIELSEILVIENIPNFLTPHGPYHSCVEEARDNSYLKDFRKWITSQNLNSKRNELEDIKKEVEEAIRKAQEELFLKSFDYKSHYKSVGKSMIGDAVGVLIPGASTVATAYEETKSFLNNRERRWQAFIVSLRNQNHN
ncbi:hypothetical protein J7E63_11080 [Bacillus sp. ISL-75]|uniref:hypothetical protein n=1 Tax=Bacillus sp. ISL-75 TaxID=2819137 RepID=UPI001BE8C076|nr:hypothetical protein [Bacillus sp. ISL-75]MBT2727477.1 hypothetical protein [Bacillus sp. ISL-75]